MNFVFVKLYNVMKWMSSQAKKLFEYLTNDPYFEDYLEKGSGPTWYLSIYVLIFLYKGTLCTYLLSLQDELSAGENLLLFNTVWMDGLDPSLNLAGLLLCLYGAFLTLFTLKDSSIRQFIRDLLATGSVNKIQFFQFTSNNDIHTTTHLETHAKLNRWAALHRIPLRIMLTLLNAHSVFLEAFVLFHLKHVFIIARSSFLAIIACQLNFIVFVLVSVRFLKLAYRAYFLALICIKAIALKQGQATTYFRNAPDSQLKAETVEAYFVSMHRLLLPLKQANAYLGVTIFVSIAANLPSNALCITMAFILPMNLPTRFVLITFAAIQLAVNGIGIYLAASVNGAVHGPSMHFISAHIRNQRKSVAGKDFQTRLFRWQQGKNVQKRQIRYLLHVERHLDQFLTNSNRRYTNQYGLAFGTLGSITLLSAAKSLFFYVKFLSFNFKRFLKPI